MDTDLQATDPSLQFMTSGVLDTTFYATYKKWLLYRTQDLNLYVAMVVMAIAVALISIFSRSWYVVPAGVVFIAVPRRHGGNVHRLWQRRSSSAEPDHG